MFTHWKPMHPFLLTHAKPGLRNCLLHTGSLTQYLDENFCKNNLELILNQQAWRVPLFDEASKLQLRFGIKVLLREIFFKCDRHILVYGRTLFPANTLYSSDKLVQKLGNESLGNFLFSDKNIYRDKLEFACLNRKNRLFNLIDEHAITNNDILYARRSVFFIKHNPILVTEIFFPDTFK